MTVLPEQRYSRARPCPVCGGYPGLPRHHGIRCFGYRSGEGHYFLCTREDYAGVIPWNALADGYWHEFWRVSCPCGHGPHYP